MIHSPELAELAAALATAQGEFESVSKDSANPFFKSKYASLPNVVKAAAPILTANGLSVSQLLGHDEQGDTLTTILLHTSGQFIGDTMHLRPVKDDPQAQGSATTYGRRYAYMAALGLVADEDDDGNAGSAGAPAKRSRTSQTAAPKSPAKGAAREGVAATEAGSQGEPSPSPSPTLDDDTLAKVREAFIASGQEFDTSFGWKLAAIGYEGPVQTEAQMRHAVQHLTAEQASALIAELGKGGQ